MKAFLATLAILVLSIHLGYAQASEQKTALDWYDHVQQLREEASKFFRGESNSREDLQIAAKKHREMIELLHSPKLAQFRKENKYLRVKDQDVYADLIYIYVRLGEAENAKKTLKLLLDFAKDPTNADGSNPGFSFMYLRSQPGVGDLEEKDPTFRQMLLELRRLDPLWDIMHTKVPYSLKYAQTISLEERLAGYAKLWSEVKFNFAFFDNSDVEWNESFRTFLPEVMAADSTFDYYRVLQKMVATLNDGHTNVYFPRDLYTAKLGGQPPIRTESLDGKVFVRRIDSASLQGVEVGDEVMAIDGEEVHAYAKREFEPYTSIATPQDRLVRMYDYLLLDGPPEKPVTVRLRKSDGQVRDVILRRSGYSDVKQVDPYSFRIMDGVAVVRINDFEDSGHISRFRADMKANPGVKGLIFDVRDNGGGNSTYAEHLVAGLIDSPVRLAPSEVREYNPLQRVNRDRLGFRKIDENYEIKPTDKWKFRGPVALLTGPRTFSAAEDFVSMFIGSKRGAVIGEATAGSTGQPMFFALPGGGSVRICVKRDYLPDGTPFVGKGIRPTIEVRHSAEDLRRGRDPVLARALQEVIR